MASSLRLLPKQLPASARGFSSSAKTAAPKPPSLLTLADLSTDQISNVLIKAAQFKRTIKDHNISRLTSGSSGYTALHPVEQTLAGKTVAIMFSKRSTRTRVASETSVKSLGGQPMFLGPQDIQLGVNESLYDTSKVVISMTDGIMARVGGHEEIEVSI